PTFVIQQTPPLYLLYVEVKSTLFSIFPSFTQVSQLKFNYKPVTFETHGFFSNMGVVAYVIAVGTSVLFFRRNGNIKSGENDGEP
nr:GPI transamidase component PIG-T [Tanacetum cinerariifolium]